MKNPSFPKVKIGELANIIYRNVFLLNNGIIFSVVALLFVFGQFRAGLFLGIISAVNIFFGLLQDIHAWLSLEKLQLLTAPRVTRVNALGKQELALAEEIEKGDIIFLKLGSQVPCDSTLLESRGLEINEGLITGESNSRGVNEGDRLLAGSLVTAGSGKIRTETIYRESRIARMTEGLKRHSLSSSPIQHSVNLFVQYAGYALLLSIVFVIVRGLWVNESAINVVLNIGALSSMLVPQGLMFLITVFFTYGAANLFRKNVLLQEVNATEKLGRIKNLCMDKTGTLTQNSLVVEAMLVPEKVSEEEAGRFVASYIDGTGDASETVSAARRFLKNAKGPEAQEVLPFSSWRQYGAVKIKTEEAETSIFGGSVDTLLPNIQSGETKIWLEKIIASHNHDGKRLLCFAESKTPADLSDILSAKLSPLAVFVFNSAIREGISDTINFFQDRGVIIRIISGDNPETVSAVAAQAGVKNADKVISGSEMTDWNPEEYEEKVKSHTIFARILPEQKEKIIEAFKKDGFTAMVGDGANDALAIKKADLGIAMFDGAPATRQLAGIVLVNNSFTALPGGVELADDIIRNIEIFSSMFFNSTFIGLLFFVVVSLLGAAYPLSPFNITVINYFTIGMPGVLITYWTVNPTEKVRPVSKQPFLKRVLPFAAWSAGLQSAGVSAVYLLNLFYLKAASPNTPVIIAFVLFGFVFFISAPAVYYGALGKLKKLQILGLGIFELALFLVGLQIPALRTFFDVQFLNISFAKTCMLLLTIGCFCLAQYALAGRFASENKI